MPGKFQGQIRPPPAGDIFCGQVQAQAGKKGIDHADIKSFIMGQVPVGGIGDGGKKARDLCLEAREIIFKQGFV